MRVVVDTSVFISAILGREGGASRAVVRACLTGSLEPVMSTALCLELEDVAAREGILERSPLSAGEIDELLDAFFSRCSWVRIYYRWRPALPDPADHHLLELAVAGNATRIVTHNVRDLRRSELAFEDLEIVTPAELAKEL